MTPGEKYYSLRRTIPSDITIVLAAKTRTSDEIKDVISAGATDIGYNYVQEADIMHQALGEQAKLVNWHMIGHLQTNKINRAIEIFDSFQTIDSVERAAALNARILSARKGPFPVLLEINIASEPAKKGFPPIIDHIDDSIHRISLMPGLILQGLMTMGPSDCDGPALRPWFKKSKKLFDEINNRNIQCVKLTTLSMGMSDSYIEAIEEGSTMVRLGSIVFGERS